MSAQASLIPELEEVIRRGSLRATGEDAQAHHYAFSRWRGPIQRRPSRSFRSGVQPVDRRGGGRGSAPNCRTGWRRSARCRPKWCGVSHTTMISRWRDRCSHSPGNLPRRISSPSPEPKARRIYSPLQDEPESRRRSPMFWSAAVRAKSLTGWRTIPARDCRNGAFSRSSSGPKSDSVLAEKVGLRPDIPARLFRDLLLEATALVQQCLLASATPAMQVGAPTPSGERFAADGCNKRPSGLRDRATHNRGFARRRHAR